MSTNAGDDERVINDQTLLPTSFFINCINSDEYDEGQLYHADDSPVLDVILPEIAEVCVVNSVGTTNDTTSQSESEIVSDAFIGDHTDLLTLQDLRPVYSSDLEEAIVLATPSKTNFQTWPINLDPTSILQTCPVELATP